MERINTLYDLETTARYWLLGLRGTRVAINREDAANAIEWCNAHVKNDWAWHHRPELISNENLVQNIDYHFTGKFEELDAETILMRALSQSFADEMDAEVLRSVGINVPGKKLGYFWFDNNEDAMLFKLTWSER